MVAIGSRSRPPVKETCRGRRGAPEVEVARPEDDGRALRDTPEAFGDMSDRVLGFDVVATGDSRGCVMVSACAWKVASRVLR